MAAKCWAQGCTKTATWECKKLWGAGGTVTSCDDHMPGSKADKNPDAIKELIAKRPFYECKPLAPASTDEAAI